MRKVKWGVLGTADIAKRCTIPGMQLAGNCEMYAVAGRSLEKANQFQAEFGFQKAYNSYDALLADPEVEAVYIPLPNELHYEWTIKALKAKKHVLCEKPLAPTVAQIEEMQRIANDYGVHLMEAFAYLHSPFVQAMKAELEKNTIGDILYMESAFITSDYDISNIRMRRETFGGAVYDLGCYNTSQVLWMFGQEPVRVQAVAEFSDNGIDVLTTALLAFPGGKRACIQCGMVLATEGGKRIDRFQIHGTKGFLRSDAEFNQEGRLSYLISAEGKEEIKIVTAPQNYKLEIEQFGRCITDGEMPHVSHEFSCMNARVLERILAEIKY